MKTINICTFASVLFFMLVQSHAVNAAEEISATERVLLGVISSTIELREGPLNTMVSKTQLLLENDHRITQAHEEVQKALETLEKRLCTIKADFDLKDPQADNRGACVKHKSQLAQCFDQDGKPTLVMLFSLWIEGAIELYSKIQTTLWEVLPRSIGTYNRIFIEAYHRDCVVQQQELMDLRNNRFPILWKIK